MTAANSGILRKEKKSKIRNCGIDETANLYGNYRISTAWGTSNLQHAVTRPVEEDGGN